MWPDAGLFYLLFGLFTHGSSNCPCGGQTGFFNDPLRYPHHGEISQNAVSVSTLRPGGPMITPLANLLGRQRRCSPPCDDLLPAVGLGYPD
ncbi:hypothetical protein FB45DRAFT_529493 [Roridomyces roridus]|uniref:Secreted protein n=1 Tax=Roridomyces roridus TaxID=1738132 RepID=A0AAD7F9B0_9AGAR|nr:hypothetical protein FB45DRAFT_529493 [Roridomyces roridus]